MFVYTLLCFLFSFTLYFSSVNSSYDIRQDGDSVPNADSDDSMTFTACPNPPNTNNTVQLQQLSTIFLEPQFTCQNSSQRATVSYNIVTNPNSDLPSLFTVWILPRCGLFVRPTWSEYLVSCSKPNTQPIYTNTNAACIAVQCDNLLYSCQLLYETKYECV
jgi:hypothetical protein